MELAADIPMSQVSVASSSIATEDVRLLAEALLSPGAADQLGAASTDEASSQATQPASKEELGARYPAAAAASASSSSDPVFIGTCLQCVQQSRGMCKQCMAGRGVDLHYKDLLGADDEIFGRFCNALDLDGVQPSDMVAHSSFDRVRPPCLPEPEYAGEIGRALAKEGVGVVLVSRSGPLGAKPSLKRKKTQAIVKKVSFRRAKRSDAGNENEPSRIASPSGA